MYYGNNLRCYPYIVQKNSAMPLKSFRLEHRKAINNRINTYHKETIPFRPRNSSETLLQSTRVLHHLPKECYKFHPFSLFAGNFESKIIHQDLREREDITFYLVEKSLKIIALLKNFSFYWIFITIIPKSLILYTCYNTWNITYMTSKLPSFFLE